MKIAIDYDQTFTLDPLFWADFIRLLKSRGHSAMIVSSRQEMDDNRQQIYWELEALDILIPIFLTSGVAKEFFCEQAKIKIDVWIDDNPGSIVNGV
jgi:hypothetical protein